MTLAPNGLDEFEGRRATPEQHLTVSDSLRATGQNAVATGDLPLASEAYWGVVAHVFQAVAERHGIRHTTNRDFEVIRDWLVDEAGDQVLIRWFQRTYELHQNFYRIIMTRDEVVVRSRFAVALADAARPFT